MNREELLDLLGGEFQSLNDALDSLARETEQAPPGIREFRKTRLHQLAERVEHLKTRLMRVRRYGPEMWDAVKFEAMALRYEVTDVSRITAGTFRSYAYAG